jgi:hypothetical protein
MRLRDLLARGYFPKELPRPFTTTSFAHCVTTKRNLPGDFAKKTGRAAKLPIGRVGVYSMARGGLQRRILGLCNPLHYFRLCQEIAQNWQIITPRVSGSPFAATAPEFKKSGRAIDGRRPLEEKAELVQHTRLGRRYILQTDINRFYHSIYTHSISWALHDKATAKVNRSNSLLGNRIDYWIRMGQDQQTVGVPIGPDTSLLMAELIMHRCDEALLAKLPNSKGHRFIDDYELSFQTRQDAEDAYHELDSCLADFELALNPKKTKIIELPVPLEPSWVTQLKQVKLLGRSARGQARELEDYFNIALALHSANPGESILNFAIPTFRSIEIYPENWQQFQRLLMLCATPEPATLPWCWSRLLSETTQGPRF